VRRGGREFLVFRPGEAKTSMAREDALREALD
jgi:hypothetical protein